LSNKWFKVTDYQEIIKILGNYCFLGNLRGAKLYAVGLFLGWMGK
jgi:hypothetical protein